MQESLRGVRLLFVALGVGSLAAGCGDSVTRKTPEDISSPFSETRDDRDAGADASDAGPEREVRDDVGPGGDTEPAEPSLAFVEPVGDDDVECQGTPRCTIFVSYNEKRSLEVVYREGGETVDGQPVQYEITKDPQGVGQITAASATTGDDGLAAVQATNAKNQVGQFEVEVSVDRAGVDPLYFDVAVQPKGQVPLTVLGTYDGERPVTTYEVRLFEQDGSGTPDCSSKEGLLTETASWQSAPTNVGQSVTRQQIPGLEEAGSIPYTVLVFARNQSVAASQPPVVAWGCEAEEAVVTYGESTTVQVELADRPPRYTGTYTVKSRFDLISALPSPIDQYVNTVLEILKSPTKGLLSLSCQLGDDVDELQDVCGFVFSDPDNPNESNLTPTGGTVVDVLDALIQSLAEDQGFGQVLQGGADVADILQSFRVTGTIAFLQQPDSDGSWAPGEVEESWDTVTVTWSLGQNCDPQQNPDCGKTNFSFNAIQPGEPPIAASFAAHVEDFWMLSIEQHPLNVQYGVLLNYVIENVLLPLLLGDGSDGGPVVNSYEKFLNLLVGGEECLQPGFGKTCCQAFAEDVVSQGASSTQGAIEGICNGLVGAGSNFIENQLGQLSTTSGEAFTIGTAEPCAFYDTDSDMVVDGFGKQAEGQRCHWTVELSAFGNSTTMDAEFWAFRAE